MPGGAGSQGSRPHRCSCKDPPRINAWVDSVSLPYRERSTHNTRSSPTGHSSRAVAAPGHSCPDDDDIPVPIHDPSPLWSGPGVDPLVVGSGMGPLAFPDPAWTR